MEEKSSISLINQEHFQAAPVKKKNKRGKKLEYMEHKEDLFKHVITLELIGINLLLVLLEPGPCDFKHLRSTYDQKNSHSSFWLRFHVKYQNIHWTNGKTRPEKKIYILIWEQRVPLQMLKETVLTYK